MDGDRLQLADQATSPSVLAVMMAETFEQIRLADFRERIVTYKQAP